MPKLAWHTGRTFYACPCGAESESDADQVPHPPEVLDCWSCKRLGTMTQWVPQSVARARAA